MLSIVNANISTIPLKFSEIDKLGSIMLDLHVKKMSCESLHEGRVLMTPSVKGLANVLPSK